MTHNIVSSEAQLNPRQKFLAREVQWFDPRPSRLPQLILSAGIGAVSLLIVGAALAAGGW